LTRIALVRHPALSGTAGLCYGRLDFPWANPEADIPPILDRLRAWHKAVIHSSPSPRCLRLAERLGTKIRVDPRLLELDFGDWEGRPWDQVPRDALDRWAENPLDFAPPGGESGAALIARVRGFAADLVTCHDRHVVVSHGGPLKVLSRLLEGQEIDLFAISPGFGSVQIFAETSTPGAADLPPDSASLSPSSRLARVVECQSAFHPTKRYRHAGVSLPQSWPGPFFRRVDRRLDDHPRQP